jgi:hypothetical protein
MSGLTFGRLIVETRVESRKRGVARWQCRCSCGTIKEINGPELRRGSTKSCGCLRADLAKVATNKSHGKSRTPEWRAYFAMMDRCNNPNSALFKYYGGRNVKVCDRWVNGDGKYSGVECFLYDMGARHSPANSLERKEVNGNYDPENCCWATKREQVQNRRNTVKDNGKALSTLSEETGIGYGTLMTRFKRGERGEDLIRPVWPNKNR